MNMEMVTRFIFLVVIIAVNANFLDILKIVEDNIDDSVHPCDDFYRHVCSKNASEGSTFYNELAEGYKKQINEILEKHVPRKIMKSMVHLAKISKNGFSATPMQKIGGKYVEICQTNSSEALVFLQKLESFFGREPTEPCWGDKCFSNLAWDSDCEHASKTLSDAAMPYLEVLLEDGQRKMKFVQTIFDNGLSSIWALHHQDEFEQLNDMFLFFKEELMKSIKKTPWLLKSGTMDAFLNISSQMRLTLPNKEISQTLSDILNYQISYENCVKTYEILGDFANEYCVLFSLQNDETYKLSVINAYNKHPDVTLLNPFVALMADNGSLALRYGSVGALLAHEMGHSVIMGDLTDGFYPYYSEEVNSCIQQQFNDTCRTYKEASCYVLDKQIDENGSDIFGIPFVYDRLKQKMGDEIHEKIAGSKRGLTHAQAYFHLVFSAACQRGEVQGLMGDEHGSDNIRINAGVIQAPDFEKVFKCSKDSRMVLSRKKQCNIFGQNAPQQ